MLVFCFDDLFYIYLFYFPIHYLMLFRVSPKALYDSKLTAFLRHSIECTQVLSILFSVLLCSVVLVLLGLDSSKQLFWWTVTRKSYIYNYISTKPTYHWMLPINVIFTHHMYYCVPSNFNFLFFVFSDCS